MICSNDIEIGDKVLFQSPTRSHCRKAIRTVTGKTPNGFIRVSKYHGWTGFIVRHDEVLGVIRRDSGGVS
jgi:hypothetical protein